MIWYLIGFIASAAVFFGGKMIELPVVLKWMIIALIWAGAVHMGMRGRQNGYRKDKSSRW